MTYKRPHVKTSRKNYTSGLGLLSVPHRSKPLQGRLSEGAVGPELACPPEAGLCLLGPLLSSEDEAQVVVGGLQFRVQTQRKAERLLGLGIFPGVIQGEPQVLVG